uniref:Uncharacterized protein n=1 Tax=Rhizophora mucronata TaxID=61149 RepID=A0A2P2PNS2_RHIMU
MMKHRMNTQKTMIKKRKKKGIIQNVLRRSPMPGLLEEAFQVWRGAHN